MGNRLALKNWENIVETERDMMQLLQSAMISLLVVRKAEREALSPPFRFIVPLIVINCTATFAHRAPQ